MNIQLFSMSRAVPGVLLLFRTLVVSACLLALWTAPSGAATPTKKLAMPDTMAMTFDGLFASTKDATTPGNGYINELLAFCAANNESGLLPERNDKGAGVYMVAQLPFSLQDVLAYMINPDVPGAALYPNSVRMSGWLKKGDLAQNWRKIANAKADGDTFLSMHNMEYEQTTPDENSGSYYGYTLHRSFVLTTDKEGRPTLISLGVQAGPSSIGLKGAVLGKDSNWNYLYTGAVGSTLPMVGWAETYVYDSATISIWTDTGSGIKLRVMKWLKAGWSGMNVVKAEHISRGVERYLVGLRQVMESPHRPSPDAIAARHKALSSMDDATLATELSTWAQQLIALAKAQSLDSEDFATACKDGYIPSLTRDERIAELMKLFMKQQLKLNGTGS